mmetsp:Transcript_62444/g.115968  ORF Transcript_62444/g.115968 Transcript_62444/m.115968 type:complete len:386 (-) Transcript_62444:75-1232(-)
MSSSSSIDEIVRDAFAQPVDDFGLPGVGWYFQLGVKASEGVYGRTTLEDNGEPLQVQHRWHWGSCAKALTATVIASLVDAQTFPEGWQTKVGDLVDTVKGSTVASATLLQLLQHRAGLEDLGADIEEQLRSQVGHLSASEQRCAYLDALVKRPLKLKPGEAFHYSNAGYILVSVAAEMSTRKPWEELVMDIVAKPLGLDSLGFGVPPRLEPGKGAPVGHDEAGAVSTLEDELWHRGSFSVHSTFTDWASFAKLHLAVLSGESSALKVLGISPASALLLQQPASPASEDEPRGASLEAPMGYAMGWQTVWEEPSDGALQPVSEPTGMLWHWGTNFSFMSGCFIQLSPPMILLASVNQGSALGRFATKTAFDAIIAKVQDIEVLKEG